MSLKVKVIVIFVILCCDIVSSEQKAGDSCTEDYTGTRGVCISSADCQSAKTALELNGVRPTFCLYDFDNPLVCCKDLGTYVPTTTTTTVAPLPAVLSKNNDDPQTTTERPRPTTTERPRPTTTPTRNDDESRINRKRVSERKCEEYSRYGAPPPPDQPLPNELIVGGVTTSLNEFPHMAAIGWLNYEDTYTFNCGGSLISPRFVVTAGHCTSDPRARERAPAVVRLGDQNIDPTEQDGANPEEIEIKAIRTYPTYAPPRQYDDIALLELATPAVLSAAIRPACLWDQARLTYATAIATGWGVSDIKSGRQSKELQKVQLTLQDTAYCERLLLAQRNRNWWGFAPTQLCAGELKAGKDTCQGDSGAPLQVKSGHVYRIVGITSFGLNNCAASGRPAVYTRVSTYVHWIEGEVWPGE